MNVRAFWIVLFVGFAAVNVYALIASGFAGLGEYLGRLGPWGIVATTDLLIALSLGVAWMWRDAQAKRAAPLPYALLTLATGSLGLLLYLIRHDAATAAVSRGERRD